MIRSYSCFFILLAYQLFAQSPFKLDAVRETALLGTGISATSFALSLISQIEPPAEDEITKISRRDVNGIDRFATYNWSQFSSDVSDVFLITHTAAPLLMLASETVRDDYKAFLVMYAEVFSMYYGVTHITKALVKRYRPYNYNEATPLSVKLRTDSKLSFFSGHAAMSFASAVFISSTYAKYFPDSKSKSLIWTVSLMSASFVAYLRVISGMHFLTDVITGAVIGSLIGHIIPEIHRSGDKPVKIDRPGQQYNLIKIVLSF